MPIIGGKDCNKVNKTPAHNETFKIGQNIKVTALHTPCHTQDSICYFMEDGEDRVVFTGDTLFIGGTYCVQIVLVVLIVQDVVASLRELQQRWTPLSIRFLLLCQTTPRST